MLDLKPRDVATSWFEKYLLETKCANLAVLQTTWFCQLGPKKSVTLGISGFRELHKTCEISCGFYGISNGKYPADILVD